MRQGAIYLALEYMDYGSLDALFHAFGTPGQMTSNLPEQVLAQILFQVRPLVTARLAPRRKPRRRRPPTRRPRARRCYRA